MRRNPSIALPAVPSAASALFFNHQSPSPCVFRRAGKHENRWTGAFSTDSLFEGSGWSFSCFIAPLVRHCGSRKKKLVTFLVLKSFVATPSQIPLTTVCNGLVNFRPQQRFLQGGSTPEPAVWTRLSGKDEWKKFQMISVFTASQQIPKVFCSFLKYLTSLLKGKFS